MISDLKEALPIACTLGAGDFKARVAWIATLNDTALRAERRMACGWNLPMRQRPATRCSK